LELRVQLLQGLGPCSSRFQKQLRQILLDMRLHRESTESILQMVSRLLEKSEVKDCQIFLSNVEKVAFDPRLAPQHSEAFVYFLKRAQKLTKA